jgi:hypothetical protein
MSAKALVIAGYVKDPHDPQIWPCPDASERYALDLVAALAADGVDVTLLASSELLEKDVLLERVSAISTLNSFADDDEYVRQAMVALETAKPDIVIRSGCMLNRALERTFASGLRSRCRPGAAIADVVAVHATTSAKAAEAAEKWRGYVLDVHHDLAVMVDAFADRAGRFNLSVVTPEGGAFPLGDVREESARAFADLLRRRKAAETVRLVPTGSPHCLFDDHPAFGRYSELAALASDASLFSGTSGNTSVRVSVANDLLITPTGADKRTVRAQELVYVEAVPDDPDAYAYSGKVPSIDTGLQAHVYRAFPALEALLHVHADAGLFLSTDAVTSFPYPCGTHDEAEEVERALRRREIDGSRTFCLNLLHHGYLFGFPPGGVERMRKEWEEAATSFRSAWLEQLLLAEADPSIAQLKPIFVGGGIVGAGLFSAGRLVAWTLSERWDAPALRDRLISFCA